MLLSSSYAPPQSQRLSPPYPQQQIQNSTMLAFPQPQDGMWNDIEAQLSSMPAPSTNPSLSRRGSTQRPSAPSTLQRGSSMRIAKPSQSASTHNSPLGLGLGSKAGSGRRMTVMGDTSGYRRRRLLEATAAIGQQQQQIIAQQSQGQMRQRAGTAMQARPMSWCSTMSSESYVGMESWNGNATQQQCEAILRKQAAQHSPESQLRLQQLQQWQQLQMAQNQQVAQQQQQQQQQAARIQQAQLQQQAQMQAQAEQNYFALNTGLPSSNNQTPYFSQQNTPLSFPTYSLPMNQYYDNSYASTPVDMLNMFPVQQDYNMYNNMNLAVPNMMAGTTPPTPETFPMADQFQPAYVSTNDSQFMLDQQVDEGEVLVGLGLYSQPEKTPQKSQMEVHVAELYARAGVPLAAEEGEKKGKGLKLEETWEPPKDQESEAEDDENDVEGDAEGEDDSSVMPPPAVPQAPMGWL